MIIHLPLFPIVLPANVMYFFKVLLAFIMFDLLDSSYTTEVVLDFNYDEQERKSILIADQTKVLGYETCNSILSLGSLFLFLFAYFVKLPLLLLAKKYKKAENLYES
jgi:hypothetical protein